MDIHQNARLTPFSREARRRFSPSCGRLLRPPRHFAPPPATDNGPCYRSGIFRRLGHQLGLSQRFPRPYTPRTHGKAERFIQTALREWAYARSYHNSQVRAAELPGWIHPYNWHRPHASLNHAPPMSRSGLDRNNLLSHHT